MKIFRVHPLVDEFDSIALQKGAFCFEPSFGGISSESSGGSHHFITRVIFRIGVAAHDAPDRPWRRAADPGHLFIGSNFTFGNFFEKLDCFMHMNIQA